MRAIFCFKVVGNVLGFFRQILYAFFFGTGVRIEALFAASTMTTVSTKLFQIGALSNVFLPIFMEVKERDPRSAWRLTSNLLTLLFLLVGSVSALLFWFAPAIVPWFVPGFGSTQREIVVFLFRIITPTILLDIVSTLMATVLHANRRFVPVENASLFGNILMLFLLVAFVRKIGVAAIAISLLSASLVQTLVLTVYAWREGFRFHTGISLKQKEILFLLRSLLPFFGYMILLQLQVWLATAVLSLLPQGSMAVVRYGSNLFTQLVALLTIPFSIVVFPNFSELALSGIEQAKEQLVGVLRKSLQMLLFLTIPAMVLMIAFRVPVIEAIYQRGHFDRTSVLMTSSVFAIFSAGFFVEGAILIFKKLLFALKRNFTAVALMACGLVVYLFFLFILVRPFGYLGIAAVSPLTTTVYLGMMVWYVHAKVADLSSLFRYFGKCLMKTIGAAIVMVMGCGGLNVLFETFRMGGTSPLISIFQAATLCLFGLAIYLVASWIFGVEELKIAWSVYGINRFWGRLTRSAAILGFEEKD